jgi:hypothetical protein
MAMSVMMLAAAVASDVPLQLLPESTGAKCLDGSPYGYYFVPSPTHSKKWTISIEGGGWCIDELSCTERAEGSLGSSKHFPKEAGCECMNVNDARDGIATDCNCIFLPCESTQDLVESTS